MAGRGEYQKQLAALVAAAKANNLKFKDIVPGDIEAEFQEMKELKAAQEYIKELEVCKKELRAAKETLSKALDEKQSEIDNLPAEYQSMKIDLQQAQRQISLYKDAAVDLEKRVARYRDQAKKIVDMEQADASAAEKIEDLQTQIEDQQAVINKLMNDNCKSEAMFEQLRELDTKALERKDKQLAKKDKELAEKEELLTSLHQQAQELHDVNVAHDDTDGTETLVEVSHDEFLAMREQNLGLLQENLSLSEQNRALEEQHIAMKTQLYEVLASQESTDRNAQFFAAVVSETKTLNRFHQASAQVLGSFAKSFSSSEADIPSLAYIESQLDAAQEALHGYFSVKKVVRAISNQPDNNDIDQIALCKELDSLAATASDSVSSLEILHQGLWSFLNRLSHDPKVLSDLNAAIDLAITASIDKKDRLDQIEYCFEPSLFSDSQ